MEGIVVKYQNELNELDSQISALEASANNERHFESHNEIKPEQ